MEHYEFISKTDKKSLFNQIKYLVKCGQQSYQNDLVTRREHLKNLLEGEEQIYENEFIGKIKSRVDKNIRERQESLLAMKRERTKEIKKFVAEKKLHQYMQNCIEIRDELRKKDYRETQLCQLEQMVEKERAIARERKDDEFWLGVQNRVADRIDKKQEHERVKKRDLQNSQNRVLDCQTKEHGKSYENDKRYAFEQQTALMESIRIGDKKQAELAAKLKKERSRDVRESLQTICNQREKLDQEKEDFEEVFHEETMRQVRKEMEEAARKDPRLKQEVLDYLNYVKHFRAFVNNIDATRDEIADMGGNYFYCFKKQHEKDNIKRKKEIAQKTHKELLKQVCEQLERQAAEEAYLKEPKIIENRFARLVEHNKFKEQEQRRKELDDQIALLKKIRAEEEKKFEEKLTWAVNDREYCQQLYERHKIDGCDYLPPHPNWKLMACYKPDNSACGSGTAKTK